jgi:hypothetical protein
MKRPRFLRRFELENTFLPIANRAGDHPFNGRKHER